MALLAAKSEPAFRAASRAAHQLRIDATDF
jgi:hypothetical protein